VRVDRGRGEEWVRGYERAWRTAGTEGLAELFAEDVSYLPSPWAEPVRGLDDLARFWEAERDGPDERFSFAAELVAVDGRIGVARVLVDYADTASGRWRDLWIIELDDAGRCVTFEEWPFAPGQPDGHTDQRDPGDK
jgi:hypothetical protein